MMALAMALIAARPSNPPRKPNQQQENQNDGTTRNPRTTPEPENQI
jgi:hypothetical protein